MAAIAVAVVAAQLDLAGGLTAGFVVAVAMSPLWLPQIRPFHGLTPLILVFAIATSSGLWLTALAAGDHVVTSRHLIEAVVVVLTIMGGVGVLVWARSLWETWQVGLFFGIGSLAAISTGGNFAANPWRFGFSLSVILIVLSLAAGSRRRGLEFVLCLILVAATALSGGRSRTGIMLLVALLLLWQMWRPARRSAASALRVVLVAGSFGLAILQFGQALVLEGFLGESAAERTQMQIAQSGSLLLGGRPEVAATIALMRDHFTGYGFGVQPGYGDVLVAKAGLRAVNYDPDNLYVDDYMFGTTFELHSVIGDMWAWMGLPGLLAAVSVVALVLFGIVRRVVRREAPGFVLFAAISMLWNVCFSPLSSSVPLMIVALALLPYEKMASTRVHPATSEGDVSLTYGALVPRGGTSNMEVVT